MKNKSFMKDLIVRDLIYEDIPKIVQLITKIYGKTYPDKEFYETKVIQSIIKDSIEKTQQKSYWKGAFLDDNLIGQMLFMIRNGTGFLKCTMVDDDYKGKRVITRVSLEMVKILEDMCESDMKCIYAFVDHENLPIIKVLKNFGFHNYGTLPTHEKDKYLLVFGRVVYDFRWKIIKPYIKLCKEIYHIIKQKGLKRLISARLLISIQKDSHIIDFQSEKDESSFPYKINFVNGRDVLANLYENEYTESWYDVTFSNILSVNTKYHIINKILEDFERHKNIKYLSFSIKINDILTQKYLLDKGIRLYAFMPFYINGEDALLMGISKISEEAVV